MGKITCHKAKYPLYPSWIIICNHPVCQTLGQPLVGLAPDFAIALSKIRDHVHFHVWTLGDLNAKATQG